MGLVLALVASLSLGARAQEAAPLEAVDEPDLYRRGVNSFEFGDCPAAITALERVAVPGKLNDEKQLIDAYRILGICYFQQGRRDDAVRVLDEVLYIDPAFELDPFRTPPPVSELFEERQAIIQKKLKEIEEQTKGSAPVHAGKTFLVERERTVKTTPFPTVFLPFGLSQWANGDDIKAFVIGGLQGVALVANVGAVAANIGIDYFADDHVGARIPGKNFELQTQALPVAFGVSVVALAGFLVSYGYGVADAWWNREPEEEVSVTEEQRELSDEEAKRLLRRLDEE